MTIAPHDPQADRAARSWLAFVDAGNSDSSLATASAGFRAKVTAAVWAQSLASTRTQFGAAVHRVMKGARPVTRLPGSPDGNYIVMQFETDFANKKGAGETVALVHDPDGQWRVTAYFIR